MPAEPDTDINSVCPRCGGAFHCGLNDSVACACGTVKLDEATLQGLRKRFSSCICLDCLRQVQVDDEGG